MAEPLTNRIPEQEGGRAFQSTPLRRSPEQERERIERARTNRNRGAEDLWRRAAISGSTAPKSQPEKLPVMPPAVPARAAEQVQLLRAKRQAERQASQPEEPAQGSILNSIGYIPAFAIAICKDLLDFVGIGSLPLIGWLVTAMASFLIFIALLSTDSSVGMKSSRRMVTRLLILFGTVIVEGLFFGLNLFPLETGAVALILLLDMNGKTLRKISKVAKYTPIGRATKGVVK